MKLGILHFAEVNLTMPRRGLYRKSRYHKLNQPSKLASLSFLRRLRASSR